MFSPFAELCEMRTPKRAVPSAGSSVNYSPLSAPAGKLPILFCAIVVLQRKCVYPEHELGRALLTGRLMALNVASTSTALEK
jgi:hypothetical protein